MTLLLDSCLICLLWVSQSYESTYFIYQLSLLNFGTFSCPVLLQLRDDLACSVFLPQGPQVLCCQRGAISFNNKPAKGGAGMIHTHDQQLNTQFTVNEYTVLLQWVRRSLKMRVFWRTSLPSEPPEQNLWQERGIFDGTGILQQIKDQTHWCFRSKYLTT